MIYDKILRVLLIGCKSYIKPLGIIILRILRLLLKKGATFIDQPEFRERKQPADELKTFGNGTLQSSARSVVRKHVLLVKHSNYVREGIRACTIYNEPVSQ